MKGQITMFEGQNRFRIDKPIRLIELFAGYGSQALALKYLGANYESWKICEWAVKSIKAYKDLHCGDDNTDYSAELSDRELIDYLTQKGISADYNAPMTERQVRNLGEKRRREIYNNIQATKNLVNIQQAHGSDFEIVEPEKYTYIMTYSFPCQDLSVCGLGKGMDRGGKTRSGMLWEVERILDELAAGQGALPQVLLMENVPPVIGAKNIANFSEWLHKLESLGYKCFYKIMNSKNYGVPQNRDRCFMVSILGDYYYTFPAEKLLERRLKDVLQKEVPEKYFLSLKGVEYVQKREGRYSTIIEEGKDKLACALTANGNENWTGNFVRIDGEAWNRGGVCGMNKNRKFLQEQVITSPNGVSPCVITRAEGKLNIALEEFGQLRGRRFDRINEQSRRIYDITGLAPTCHTCGGGNTEPKIAEPIICASRGRNPNNPSDRMAGTPTQQRLEIGGDISNTLTTVTKDDQVAEPAKKYYRIRKLTPLECFRLMGVRDEDYQKVAQNQSDSSLYHLAGDSIVVDVLMAIFGEML